MPITITDPHGEHLTVVSSDSRTFRRALDRGQIARTGEPLVYRLVREVALKPIAIDGRTGKPKVRR